MTLNGLAARIVQHEYDHLNGILLIDRINQNLPVNAQKRA
jgi:peptide deformylase